MYAEYYEHININPGYTENIPEEMPLYYFLSGFSKPRLPVATQDGLFLFEWGLIPFWVKDAASAREIQMKTLNAVGETVFEKPAFKKAIASQRCLLAISGFFEWMDVHKTKYPHFIKLKNRDIFSLGCIYDTWVDKQTGELIKSFSIITTPANPLLAKIHNLKKRMPLILKREQEADWINPLLPEAEIKKLMVPYDETDMQAYTISKLANGSRNNRNIPEILQPVQYIELL